MVVALRTQAPPKPDRELQPLQLPAPPARDSSGLGPLSLPQRSPPASSGPRLGALFASFSAPVAAVVVGAAAFTATPAVAEAREAAVDIAREVLFGGAPLAGAVGVGQRNASTDVRTLKTRLADLGFALNPDARWTRDAERALRVFEAMVTGATRTAATAGKIVPGGALHRALASPDAPRWVEMPATGAGFVLADGDGFRWGSSMLRDVVVDAGKRYSTWVATHPGKALIALNDASRRTGGPHTHHQTHQAGLDIDLRLPRLDGTHGTIVGRADYDREATLQMIRAFAEDPRTERVLFGDPRMLRTIAASTAPWKTKVADGGADHRNHIHVDVAPWRAPVVG